MSSASSEVQFLQTVVAWTPDETTCSLCAGLKRKQQVEIVAPVNPMSPHSTAVYTTASASFTIGWQRLTLGNHSHVWGGVSFSTNVWG